MPTETPPADGDLRERLEARVERWFNLPDDLAPNDEMSRQVVDVVMAEVSPVLERLRGELAAQIQRAEIAEHDITRIEGFCRDQRQRAERYRLAWQSARGRARRLRDERDLLRETLAESDLGALTLAQWEAIAAADADRDRLEAERDALTAAIEQAREGLKAALAAWEPEHEYHRDRARRKGYTHNQTAAEVYGDAIKAATEAIAALDAPENTPDAPTGGED